MSLSGSNVYEIRATGDDKNGGAFVSGGAGTDYSQQDSAQVVFDGSTITATTSGASATLTLTGVVPDSSWVDNHLNIESGTNFTAGLYRIISISGSTITLDRAATTGVGSAMVARMGGAMKSLGGLGRFVVGNNIVWIKAGAYSITSASTNVVDGCITYTGGSGIYFEGYESVRGDMGNPPVFTASGISTATFIDLNVGNHFVRNITLDGANLTSVRGLQLRGAVSQSQINKVFALNCTNTGIFSTSNQSCFSECKASGCNIGMNVVGNVYACEAFNNTGDGISISISGSVVRCLAYGNGGRGIFSSAQGVMFALNTAYGNAGDNIRLGQVAQLVVDSAVEGSTGGMGINRTNNQSLMLNCAAYNNSGGDFSTFTTSSKSASKGSITGTSTFFVNAVGGDFSPAINSPLRDGGDGDFVGGNTVSHHDIGASQHPDP